jgi:hypothetical protein
MLHAERRSFGLLTRFEKWQARKDRIPGCDSLRTRGAEEDSQMRTRQKRGFQSPGGMLRWEKWMNPVEGDGLEAGVAYPPRPHRHNVS